MPSIDNDSQLVEQILPDFVFKENVTDSCVEDNVSLETADDKQSKLWKHELMGTWKVTAKVTNKKS